MDNDQLKGFENLVQNVVKAGTVQAKKALKTVATMNMIFNFTQPVTKVDIKNYLEKYRPTKAKNAKIINRIFLLVNKIRKERLAFEKKQKSDVGKIFDLIK